MTKLLFGQFKATGLNWLNKQVYTHNPITRTVHSEIGKLLLRLWVKRHVFFQTVPIGKNWWTHFEIAALLEMLSKKRTFHT